MSEATINTSGLVTRLAKALVGHQQAATQAAQSANVAAQARNHADRMESIAAELADILGIASLDEAVKANAFGLADAIKAASAEPAATPAAAPVVDSDEFGA